MCFFCCKKTNVHLKYGIKLSLNMFIANHKVYCEALSFANCTTRQCVHMFPFDWRFFRLIDDFFFGQQVENRWKKNSSIAHVYLSLLMLSCRCRKLVVQARWIQNYNNNEKKLKLHLAQSEHVVLKKKWNVIQVQLRL